MKFFTLIYGDRIQLAPKGKVVPSEEFSLLMEGKEVLEKVQQEADRYREEVAKDTETLKEQAELAGFEAGLEKWGDQLAHFDSELQKAKAEIEKLIVPVAINAAKKVVARELHVDPETIVDIVKQSLKAVSQHHRFIIYVNKTDHSLLDANRPKLKEVLESVESLSVRERDDVLPGDCVIETEAGIINVRMEQVWITLEHVFRSLLKNA